MTVHGSLGAGAMAMYPATVVNSYVTRVIQFVNSSEQRWTVRSALFGAVLSFQNLNGYDLSLLRNFFVQMKGSFVDDALLNTFSMTLAGVSYSYLHLDSDSFESECDGAERYSCKLKVSQVRPN